jgi:hypothetical protein
MQTCCVVAGVRLRSGYEQGELVFDWLEARQAVLTPVGDTIGPYSPVGGAWTQLVGCQHSILWGAGIRDLALVAAVTRDAGVVVHRMREPGEQVPEWLWPFLLAAERCCRSDPYRLASLVRTTARYPLSPRTVIALRTDEYREVAMTPLIVSGRRLEQLRIAACLVGAHRGSGLESYYPYVADCIQPWLRLYRYEAVAPGPRPPWDASP